MNFENRKVEFVNNIHMMLLTLFRKDQFLILLILNLQRHLRLSYQLSKRTAHQFVAVLEISQIENELKAQYTLVQAL